MKSFFAYEVLQWLFITAVVIRVSTAVLTIYGGFSKNDESGVYVIWLFV